MRKSHGFTLIEVLVVLGVLTTVGAVIVSILATTFRSINKASVIGVVSENGNYAISQITKMVRNAKSFNGVSTDDATYITDCYQAPPPNPTPTAVPTNYSFLKITSFDEQVTTFSCSTGTIASNSASLINTTSVAVASCSFICRSQSPFEPPSIGIVFTLTQAAATGVLLPENTITVPFASTIQLRNVSQ